MTLCRFKQGICEGKIIMAKKRYSLVVADDEVTIRKGICNYIDWETMGFEVIADFEDGKETVEYLQEHSVDVVLTDIRMAEVTGLDVARYVFEHQLPIKVVIISGYKEFEYAKQAIKYDVMDYILKPIHMDELERSFQKIYDQLQAEEKEREGAILREQNLEEILPELQEQFWMSILLGGGYSRENILHKRELLSLKFSMETPCAVISVQIQLDQDMTQKYYQEKNNRYNLLNNIFAGENGGLHFYPVYLSAEHLKAVVTTGQAVEQAVFEQILKEQLMEKTSEVKMLLSLDMLVQVENSFHNISELTDYYNSFEIHAQKQNRREYRLNPEDYERLQQKYQFMMDTINAGDFEALDCLLGNLLFELRSLPFEEVKGLLIDMFSMLMQKFMKISPELWREVKENVDYSTILNAKDRGEVKEVCSGLLKTVMEIVNQRQNEDSRKIVDRVMEYIRGHYSEEISLDKLAERYYLNSSYLSRLFKQYTGSCITDYLIELRMEAAKELLLTGKYKVYEVSQKVGYRSDKYFFRVFKQYTGQSPSEFCRSRTGEKTV